MAAIVIHCSCPDAASAARIARALVDERLAACVQVLPGMTSTYRWHGEVHVDTEVLLLIKTVAARLDALKARIAALHPYEVPELLAFEAVDGAPGYLGWLEQACAGLESPDAATHPR
ncbi:divalent-cation tolerance protein CutA [Dokdonella sp.]|uniref:divalent-cation tolerance protein CutA n=1 Tax=Dokdonella sp. TaxID=2291710 RepID=UPI002F402CC1